MNQDQELVAKDFNDSAAGLASQVVEFGKKYPTVHCAEGHTEQSTTLMMKSLAQSSIDELELTYAEWGLLQEMARQLGHQKRS